MGRAIVVAYYLAFAYYIAGVKLVFVDDVVFVYDVVLVFYDVTMFDYLLCSGAVEDLFLNRFGAALMATACAITIHNHFSSFLELYIFAYYVNGGLAVPQFAAEEVRDEKAFCAVCEIRDCGCF